MSGAQPGAPLLEVRDLAVRFEGGGAPVDAVRGVSFSIARGETVALVGESGSGKSVTALSLLQLLPPGARHPSGSIRFDGRELVGAPEATLRAVRGDRIAMIFQEPMTSLNPVYTVGDQVGEAVRLHQKTSKAKAREVAIEMFRLVGIPSPEQRVDNYPHQLSGGMRQRVMIAMALSCNPKLLIADEPTTALDVTVQAQILDLLRDLQERLNMATLLITHDLGVVASMARRVSVMYAGRVVESADIVDVFERPQHPYTVGLLESLPKLGEEITELRPIEGNVPDALALPSGCRFHPRCPFRFEPCPTVQPEFVVRDSHGAACHYTEQNPDADLLVLRRQRAEQPSVVATKSPGDVS